MQKPSTDLHHIRVTLTKKEARLKPFKTSWEQIIRWGLQVSQFNHQKPQEVSLKQIMEWGLQVAQRAAREQQ
jgi:hypothetical protein